MLSRYQKGGKEKKGKLDVSNVVCARVYCRREKIRQGGKRAAATIQARLAIQYRWSLCGKKKDIGKGLRFSNPKAGKQRKEDLYLTFKTPNTSYPFSWSVLSLGLPFLLLFPDMTTSPHSFLGTVVSFCC